MPDQPGQVIDRISREIGRGSQREHFVVALRQRAFEIGEQLVAERRTVHSCLESSELIAPGAPLYPQLLQRRSRRSALHGLAPEAAFVPEGKFKDDPFELGHQLRLGVGDEGANESQFGRR